MNFSSFISKIYTKAYANNIWLYAIEVEPFVRLFTFGQQPRFKNLVVKEMEKIKPGRVVQFGCVPGTLSKEVAKAINGTGKLLIVDVSRNALKLTRKKTEGLNNVELLESNAVKTNFGNGEFDAAIIFFLLHEVPKKMKIKVLNEASRILKKDGYLFIADYHKASRGLIHNTIEKIIRVIEPFSGELMEIDLQKILKSKGFQIQKLVLGKFSLYQFVVAKKKNADMHIDITPRSTTKI